MTPIHEKNGPYGDLARAAAALYHAESWDSDVGTSLGPPLTALGLADHPRCKACGDWQTPGPASADGVCARCWEGDEDGIIEAPPACPECGGSGGSVHVPCDCCHGTGDDPEPGLPLSTWIDHHPRGEPSR